MFYKSVCTERNDGVVGRQGRVHRQLPLSAFDHQPHQQQPPYCVIEMRLHQRPQSGKPECLLEVCNSNYTRGAQSSISFFPLLSNVVVIVFIPERSLWSKVARPFCPQLTEFMIRRFMASGVCLHSRLPTLSTCADAPYLTPYRSIRKGRESFLHHYFCVEVCFLFLPLV